MSRLLEAAQRSLRQNQEDLEQFIVGHSEHMTKALDLEADDEEDEDGTEAEVNSTAGEQMQAQYKDVMNDLNAYVHSKAMERDIAQNPAKAGRQILDKLVELSRRGACSPVFVSAVEGIINRMLAQRPAAGMQKSLDAKLRTGVLPLCDFNRRSVLAASFGSLGDPETWFLR